MLGVVIRFRSGGECGAEGVQAGNFYAKRLKSKNYFRRIFRRKNLEKSFAEGE